jgi:putative heme iron utilization protein
MTTFVHAQYPTIHFGVERAKLGLSVAQDLGFSIFNSIQNIPTTFSSWIKADREDRMWENAMTDYRVMAELLSARDRQQ